ncbi:MAG: transglutaminase domain-containing protein [Candidatus Woesearchaeota archaeon]
MKKIALFSVVILLFLVSCSEMDKESGCGGCLDGCCDESKEDEKLADTGSAAPETSGTGGTGDAGSQKPAFPSPYRSKSYNDEDESDFYLREGPQSRITQEMKNIADSISGSGGMDTVEGIMEWEKSNLHDCGDKSQLRQRTAGEIIDSGCAQGCTDYGLVFVALARAKGIPASYADTIRDSYLQEIIDDGRISGTFYGHVFSDVLVDGSWKTVDPTAGRTLSSAGGYELDNRKYTLFARGLDNSDLGYTSDDEFKRSVASAYGIQYN